MSPDVEVTENARRRKRRLAVWSIPAALAALAVAAKLLSVGVLGAMAAGEFDSGNKEGVSAAAAWLLPWNVLEPHKALFASGDAKAMAGDFAGARQDFAAALEAGAGVEECKVRVNLALSLEKLGDAAASSADSQAAALYGQALDVVEAAPADCHQDGPSNSAGEGRQMDAAAKRLETKKDAPVGDASADSQAPEQQPSTPQQEQLRQLQDSAERARRERAEGQDRDDYLRSPDSPGVERPW